MAVGKRCAGHARHYSRKSWNYVSEEPGASFIRVTKIGELGTTQAATSNRRTLRRIVTVVKTSNLVPPKRRFLQGPHGVTTQKTPFFIVTAVKTSKLKNYGVNF
jgi:hypothetical protein